MAKRTFDTRTVHRGQVIGNWRCLMRQIIPVAYILIAASGAAADDKAHSLMLVGARIVDVVDGNESLSTRGFVVVVELYSK